tara:strand:- start:501 stop:836 length:336 start_codon:yes stop_codon:yes gene_type:complete
MMNITKNNAYEVVQELEHQARTSATLADEIASAIQVVENNELPPRKTKEVFNYFAEQGLTHIWQADINGGINICEIHKEGFFEPIVSMTCDGISAKSLRQAIEYVMDQDEL